MEQQAVSALDQKGDMIDDNISSAPMNVKVIEIKAEYQGGKEEIWVSLKTIEEEPQYQNVTHKRLKDIKPEGPYDDSDIRQVYNNRLWMEVVKPAYDAWVEGNQLPEDGKTPLGAWHHLTHEAADYLKTLGYLSVEDVAEMDAAVAAEIPMQGAPDLPELAKSFLESKEQGGAVAQLQPQIDRLTEENEALRERIKQMDSRDSEQGARFKGMEVVVDGRRYASRKKADGAWGFKDGTIGGHLKAGTLDLFIENEKKRREEAGEDWPGKGEDAGEDAEAA